MEFLTTLLISTVNIKITNSDNVNVEAFRSGIPFPALILCQIINKSINQSIHVQSSGERKVNNRKK